MPPLSLLSFKPSVQPLAFLGDSQEDSAAPMRAVTVPRVLTVTALCTGRAQSCDSASFLKIQMLLKKVPEKIFFFLIKQTFTNPLLTILYARHSLETFYMSDY